MWSLKGSFSLKKFSGKISRKTVAIKLVFDFEEELNKEKIGFEEVAFNLNFKF